MTLRAGHRPIHDDGAWVGPPPDALRAHPSNRRRLVVFLATLVVALPVSVGLVWLRPAEYRAAARVEITPATTTAPNAPSATIPTSDPIAGMQAHLEALPVPKTNVVELIGTGPDAEILAPLVNITSGRPVTGKPAARLRRPHGTGAARRTAHVAARARPRRRGGTPSRGGRPDSSCRAPAHERTHARRSDRAASRRHRPRA